MADHRTPVAPRSDDDALSIIAEQPSRLVRAALALDDLRNLVGPERLADALKERPVEPQLHAFVDALIPQSPRAAGPLHTNRTVAECSCRPYESSQLTAQRH
jgi:hypothetical protein